MHSSTLSVSKSLAVAATVAASLLGPAAHAASSAAAQVAKFALDSDVTGQLSAADESIDGIYHDTWTFMATQGQTVSIAMSSTDVDSLVSVGQIQNGAYVELANNDDLDPDASRDAKVDFAAPADGTYVVRAKSYGPNELGAYTLKSTGADLQGETGEAERDAAYLAKIALDPSSAVTGSISPTDPVINPQHFDAYTFTANAGDLVVIEMHSDQLDSVLSIGIDNGGAFSEITTNDDDETAGASGRNSRIVFTVPATGEYVVRATVITGDGNPGTLGDYELVTNGVVLTARN